MTLIDFNLNNYVYFKLTPRGLKWALNNSITLNEQDGGWYKELLWSFMNDWGDTMYLGADPCVEMSVRLAIDEVAK